MSTMLNTQNIFLLHNHVSQSTNENKNNIVTKSLQSGIKFPGLRLNLNPPEKYFYNQATSFRCAMAIEMGDKRRRFVFPTRHASKVREVKKGITTLGHLDDKVAVNIKHSNKKRKKKKSTQNKRYNGITHEPHWKACSEQC